MNKKQTGGYEEKQKTKLKRKDKILKIKKSKKLLAGEPSEGGVLSVVSKTKFKKGKRGEKFKKSLKKTVDKEGSRKTKVKTRVTRKGVVKKKTVVWEDGKRKVIKTRDGKVVKKKGYQTGGKIDTDWEGRKRYFIKNDAGLDIEYTKNEYMTLIDEKKKIKKIKKGKKKAATPKQTMKKFQSGGFLEDPIEEI